MRKIEISWRDLGAKVTIELDGRNPGLADLLWRNLPYRSVQGHAYVAGEYLFHLAPIRELVYTPASYKEDRRLFPDGTVFLSQLQHLGIKYGELTEPIPASPVGRVRPADVAVLREVGRTCWQAEWSTKQVIEASVTRKGERFTAAGFPAAPRVRPPRAQQLIDEIHAEVESSWLEPPREVLDIHKGVIESRAGSYDQYFTTMVFVNGEVRPLGYASLNSLVRLCQTTDLPLATLVRITPEFLHPPAAFLGYCGLDKLHRWIEETLAVLSALESRDEYFGLISTLAMYTNLLNAWNLHFSPWQLGAGHGFPKTAQASA
jgi:hypothetical protein